MGDYTKMVLRSSRVLEKFDYKYSMLYLLVATEPTDVFCVVYSEIAQNFNLRLRYSLYWILILEI
jgi:hypothetical protein